MKKLAQIIISRLRISIHTPLKIQLTDEEMEEIIYHLENDRFNRLRIGVGKPKSNHDLADFVLSNFSEDEFNKINDLTPLIISLIENFITGGIDSMLNFYSRESLRNSSNNPITE